MTAGCARCGACCEHIYCNGYDSAVKWTAAALEGVPDPGTDEGWAYWTADPAGYWADGDGRREIAIRKFAPGSRTRADAEFLAAHWHAEAEGTYSCDQFDPVTRLCTAHDARPPVCRDYPWYGEQPSAERGRHMGATCSYLWDLPRSERPDDARPLIPLTVV